MSVDSDKIVYKKRILFFVKTITIKKADIKRILVQFRPLFGGYIIFILKDDKKVTVNFDLLNIEKGILPDVELDTSIYLHPRVYLTLATAKFFLLEWGIPYSSKYLKVDKV